MSATTTDEPRDGLGERFGALIYDPFLHAGERRSMAVHRAELLAAARGRVLEIGAGTGLNLRHYPAGLDELVLCEPVAPMAERLERRAAAEGRDARVVMAPAERLPFDDDSFDTVVSTLVLCTVDEPERALAEVRRVLAPGGRLLFAEHVKADSERLARWQDRLHGPWRAFASGCHTNRDTLAALRASGLDVREPRRSEWRGMPRIVRPLILGEAVA